ncbi:MAG: family 43 glycosylhydrolase [Clostridia bacterium]|nr:family 43 glycosylhydrolase [Clostridia bacterium]
MNEYKNPFIYERADPFITKGPDGLYYFTASYPAVGDALHGYDRIILRRSKTVKGLADSEEKTLWHAHKDGIMSRHIWAPEIHYIKNTWYIFFAAATDKNIWDIKPYVLRCKDKDPYTDNWEEMGVVKRSENDELSFRCFSLDMTYFEHGGKHFLIWAQIEGASSLFMAETYEDTPWILKSKPILLTKPEYDWEKVIHKVNEGAAVLKTENKIYVFFSASGTGAEYCIGRLEADINSDLMDPNSWKKLPSPVLSTSDLVGEVGPGHNSFVTDENGELLLVYHARPYSHLEKNCGTYCSESLYDPCRHTRIREITHKFPSLT